MVAYYLGVPEGQDFKDFLGPRWHFHMGDAIQSVPKEFVEIWLKNPQYLEMEGCKDHPPIKRGLEALEECMKAFMRCYTEECMYIELSPPKGRIPEQLERSRQTFVQDNLPLRGEADPPVRVAPNQLV